MAVVYGQTNRDQCIALNSQKTCRKSRAAGKIQQPQSATSSATRLFQGGVPEKVIKEITGHCSDCVHNMNAHLTTWRAKSAQPWGMLHWMKSLRKLWKPRKSQWYKQISQEIKLRPVWIQSCRIWTQTKVSAQIGWIRSWNQVQKAQRGFSLVLTGWLHLWSGLREFARFKNPYKSKKNQKQVSPDHKACFEEGISWKIQI